MNTTEALRRDVLVILEREHGETSLSHVGAELRAKGWRIGERLALELKAAGFAVQRWDRSGKNRKPVSLASPARYTSVAMPTAAAPRLISVSSIRVEEGIEGPQNDPYSYTEWTLSRGSDSWLIHSGLGEWIKLNGETIAEPDGGEIEAALTAAGCPLSLKQIKRYYARMKAAPLKAHKAHGGMREAAGFPGETLLICKCGAVLNCDFNIGAII